MLRIITGHFRGRKLNVPPSTTTRPTTDRVRESIFNLLESYLANEGLSFENLTILDAFAGSGALGFEALSRGAKHITFFDASPLALKVIHENAAHLKCEAHEVTIKRVDTTRPPKSNTPAGIIFLDPPYEKGLLKPTYTALSNAGWINDQTILVIETAATEVLPEFLSDKIQVQRTYGSTSVSIARP